MTQDKNDSAIAEQSAAAICSILQDFIPAHCFAAAMEHMKKTCEERGIELCSRAMRKDYEELRKR